MSTLNAGNDNEVMNSFVFHQMWILNLDSTLLRKIFKSAENFVVHCSICQLFNEANELLDLMSGFTHAFISC